MPNTLKLLFAILICIVSSLMIISCSDSDTGKSNSDLELFMKNARSKLDYPTDTEDEQEQAMTFLPYSSSSLRSPFQKFTGNRIEDSINTNIRPNLTRERHFLETMSLDSFIMVGTIEQDNNLYALIKTPKGIFKVKNGAYIGKNHGKVVSVGKSQLRLIEIVPSGPKLWVERPRILRINTKTKKKENNTKS